MGLGFECQKFYCKIKIRLHRTGVIIYDPWIDGLYFRHADIFMSKMIVGIRQDLGLTCCRSRSISSLNLVGNFRQLSRYTYEGTCKISKIYFLIYLHKVLKPDQAPFLKILKIILPSKGPHQNRFL